MRRELIFQGLQTDGWWLWLGVVALAAVLIVLLLRLERKLVTPGVGWLMLFLRLAVLGTLFLTVLQPVMTWSQDREKRGQVLIALDVSESMSTADKQASESEKLRWARALGMYGNAATRKRIDRWLKALDEGREPAWVDPEETQDPIRRRELAATRRENLQGVFDELTRLTRTEIAMRLLTQTENPLLKQIDDVANTQLRIFAKKSDMAEADLLSKFVDEPPISIGTGTSSLTQALTSGEAPLIGVVLLTDGRDTSGQDPVNIAAQLGALGAPVCPVVLGSEFRPKDLSIGTLEYPQTVFLDDNAVLSAEILSFGRKDEDVLVTLEQDGEVVESRSVRAGEGSSRVEFKLETSEEGRKKYQIKVEPQEGETREDNNEAEFAITIVDDRARVLLVDGESRWEFRFMHRALDRDERVDVSSVVFEQPYIGQLNSTYFARALVLPKNVEEIDKTPLADVDVVIVGDIAPEKLTDEFINLLDRYVSELGGTVVFQAGKRHMPQAHQNELLLKMLPIKSAAVMNLKGLEEAGSPRERGLHLFVTAEALDEAMFQFVEGRFENRRFWQQLPGHNWAVVSEAKPGANVFACVFDPVQQQNFEYERKNAVIAHQYYGFGQVLWMGIDSTWRWRFREGDKYHHRFWGQLARWAASNKASAGNDSVRLKLSATELQEGEDLTITALWSQRQISQQPNTRATAIVKRLGPDGGDDEVFAKVPLEPEQGRTRAHGGRLPAPPAGSYRIELIVNGQEDDVPITADFFVEQEKSLELSDVSCNRELLQQIADASGGRVFNANEVDQIAEMFMDKNQTETEETKTELWDHWIMMLVFFGLLTVEWIVRKLNGLP